MNQIQKTYNRRRNNTPVGIDPTEESLVRTIHWKVGGPAKLSTYDDPADVRDVVLRALANEQPTAADADRINRGDLTPLERRVVRTVTNRGAAVRSRMRQQKELQRLRDEITRKDALLSQLMAMVATCSKHAHLVRMGSLLPNTAQLDSDTVAGAPICALQENPASSAVMNGGDEFVESSEFCGPCHAVAPPNSCASSSTDSLFGFGHDNRVTESVNPFLDVQTFPNEVDLLS